MSPRVGCGSNFILQIMKVFREMCILKMSRGCVENNQKKMEVGCDLRSCHSENRTVREKVDNVSEL